MCVCVCVCVCACVCVCDLVIVFILITNINPIGCITVACSVLYSFINSINWWDLLPSGHFGLNSANKIGTRELQGDI